MSEGLCMTVDSTMVFMLKRIWSSEIRFNVYSISNDTPGGGRRDLEEARC